MSKQSLQSASVIVLLFSLSWEAQSLSVRAQALVPDQLRPAGGPEWFAAIAVSDSTKRMGYSLGQPSLARAEAAAIANSGAPDARLLSFAKNGAFCAFVYETATNIYGGGCGPTGAAAVEQAFQECRKRASQTLEPSQCDFLCLQAIPPTNSSSPPPSPRVENSGGNMVYRPNPVFAPVFGRTYSNQPGFYYSQRNPQFVPQWGRTYSNRP